MTGIVIITLLITSAYVFLIFRLIRGWHYLPEYLPLPEMPKLTVSLIIPFRDEKHNLEHSLPFIMNLSYPSSLLEVIYVNDHSQDGSEEFVSGIIKGKPNFHLLHSGTGSYGKKAALMEASLAARGELLLFTDADCCPVPEWVKTMASFYFNKDPVMITGPVIMHNRQGLFNKLQALELFSLTGTSAGSIAAGDPVLCSGANIGFNRKVYLKSFDHIKPEVNTGDDIFMMLYLKKVYPGKIFFVKSREAVVFTEPVKHLFAFARQRARWASKARYYRDTGILTTAIIVFFMNLLFPALLIAGIFNITILGLLIIMLILKSVPDFLLLYGISSFFRRKKLLRLFIPAQLLYPVYSVFSGIAGILMRNKWKGKISGS